MVLGFSFLEPLGPIGRHIDWRLDTHFGADILLKRSLALKFPVSRKSLSWVVLAFSASSFAVHSQTLPPGAVATVNGVPVLKATIDDHLWRESGSVTLDFIIKSQIVHAEAAKRGIAITPDELKTRMLDYKTTFLTAAGHTPVDWENFVARYGLKLIESQQMDTLLTIRIGEDEAKKTALTPSDEARVRADLTRAAHKVHGRIILIGVGPEFGGRPEAAAKERVAAARAAIDAGKAWDEVCLEYSDDVSTRPHAGDLGLVTREQVEKPLEEFLFSAKPGPDSRQVLRLEAGYVLAEVLDRQDNLPTEAEIKKAMDETLTRKKAIAQEVTSWYPVIEKNYSVQRLLPYRR